MDFILGKRESKVNPRLKKFKVQSLGVRRISQYKIKTPNYFAKGLRRRYSDESGIFRGRSDSNRFGDSFRKGVVKVVGRLWNVSRRQGARGEKLAPPILPG